MKKKEQLAKLIKEHTSNPTDNNTTSIINPLSGEPIYFDNYFKDTEALIKISYASNNKGKGSFHDIAISSTNYPNTFDLVEVKLNDTEEIIYVSTENISFDE